MDYTVRKVDNGFVVRIDGEDPVEGYVDKEMVFTKDFQVLRFLKEQLKKQDEK
jgi:hypothetical protein